MKTSKLLFIGCAALMMGAASCSNDLPTDGENIYEGPVTTNFMSVDIVSGGDSKSIKGTRAEGEQHETDEDGTYVTGYENENKVESVRFYFFKANGDAANVKNTANELVNYLDWAKNPAVVDPQTPDDDVTNVEKIVRAQLIISTKAGDELPSQVIAVVNDQLSADEAKAISSITNLNTKTSNYAITQDSPLFVMSNSVYVDDNGKLAEAVPVAGHLYNDPDVAINNPVTIYVERVNAKATVTIDQLTPADGMGDNVFDTGVKINDAADNGLTEGLTTGKIYVKFLGWDVTSATNQSYLMKHIDASWKDEDVFGQTTATKWNIPGRYRSFWAINPSLNAPTLDGSNYVFKSFNQHKDTRTDFGSGNNNYLYLQENAALDAGSGCSYPTQLIVAAQLLNENGQPLTLAEYGFYQYTLNGLKTEMANKANIWKEDTEYTGEGSKYVKIDASDIVLLSAIEAGQASASVTEGGRYYVYAAIKGTNPSDPEFNPETATTDYYIDTTGDNPQPATYQAINALLVTDCGHAKLWEGGNTYYYVDIQHLGEEGSKGFKGVVRNHIYALGINSLTGLGTPVYRPDEVIYPEKPNNEDTYIGAEIKILTWRLVNQGVSFAW